jgi:Tfp pilus assembly protein PilO
MIAGGASLAVMLLWFIVLWSPRTHAIAKARERTQLAQQQQDDLRVRIARLKAAQRDEPAKRAEAESLRAAIPDEPNLAQFILDTNDAATRSGIDFLSIAPTPPAAAAGNAPATIALTMSVSGGYFQVLDFLNRLDSMSRLVVVKEVTVGGRAAETGRLNVSLNAAMFTSQARVASAPTSGSSASSSTSSTSSTTALTTSTTGGAP